MDTKPSLSAWPVPETTPRTIKALGLWKRSTHQGVGMVVAVVMTLVALAASVVVFARSLHPMSLICPLMLGLSIMTAFGTVAWQRRKNRLLLTEGLTTLGHITNATNNHNGHSNVNIFNYTFETQTKQTIRGSETIVHHRGQNTVKLAPKTPVVVLYDRSKPKSSTIPGLYEIEFEEVFDRRVQDLSPPPVRDGAVKNQEHLQIEAGGLVIDADGISQDHDGVRAVSWDKPFSVQLTAWLLTNDTARLQVALRTQGAPVTTPPVIFCAELPQAAISRRVPIKRSDAPSATRETFDRIWSALRWYGAMHGTVLSELDLGRVDPKPAPKTQGVRLSRNAGPLFLAAVQVAFAGVMWLSYDYMDPIREATRDCEDGSPRGCASLARLMEKGTFRVDADPDRAFNLYKKACDLGDIKTCSKLGWRYYKGEGVAQDDKKALHFFETACKEDDAGSCLQHGWMIENGRGTKKDSRRASRSYKIACDGKKMMACHNLGVLMTNGSLGEKDHKEAVRFYSMACESGNMRACTNLGWQAERGKGTRKSHDRAIALYEKACKGRNAQGCANLGWLHQNKDLDIYDLEKAASWSEKACDMDNATGCANLGWLYQHGEGVDQSDKTALRHFDKGCTLGLDRACVNMAWLIEKGRGAKQDDTRAIELYARACDRNYARACSNLGWFYDRGKGVAQDDQRAVELYGKGCDGGIGHGCNNLGTLVEKGRGVSKNVTRARKLYQKSCDMDHALGCSNLGLLYKKGISTTPNNTRAIELFERACVLGEAKGCGQWGEMLRDGQGVEKDEEKGLELIADACERGKTQFCLDEFR